MTYTVKEIFKTLQGEGAFTGAAAVFCRFSGCNLWSGREEDRSKAICQFCDTDFVGGQKYDRAQLVDTIEREWGSDKKGRMVVLTGGEPMLQVDRELVEDLHGRGFFVAVETNGTKPVLPEIDWVVVSPKAGTMFGLSRAHELKLAFPQGDLMPDKFTHLLQFVKFARLQPIDDANLIDNTKWAVDYCMNNPPWCLSIQIHKVAGFR